VGDDDDERPLTSRRVHHTASMHSVTTVQRCVHIKQYNLTPDKNGGL